MANYLHGEPDADDANLIEVRRALDLYEQTYPGSEATLFRHGPFAIRCRVIAPHFAGMTTGTRQRQVFDLIRDRVPDEAYLDIWEMLCLTPDETDYHLNRWFEDPTPFSELAGNEA